MTDKENNNIHDQFAFVYENLKVLIDMSKTCLDDIKGLQKQYKVLEKKTKIKKKRPQALMELSKELGKFLNTSENHTKADVMKMISTYIKENNLQVETNKRKFVPNKALLKLFKLSKAEEMTFVEINKYIIPHLSKLE